MSKNWKPEIQTWPVTKLTGYARNTKHHNERQVNALAGSISAYGFVVPILADSQGIIIAGHCRVEAAKKLGMQEVPVIVADHLSEGEVRALRLADNRLNESPWDTDMLRFELKGLEDMGIDLSLAAFGDIPDLTKFIEDGKIVDGLFDSPRHTGEEPESLEVVEGEDDIPEVPEKLMWVKPGDLWALGRHRLLCASATDRSNIDRLLNGQSIDMAYCDPPYGADIVNRTGKLGGTKPFGNIGNMVEGKAVKAGVYQPIIGDESTETAKASFEICDDISKTQVFWGAQYYAEALPPSSGWIVWDKQTDGSLGDGELAYTNQSRAIRIFAHKWSGMIKASEKNSKRVHPTQKPIALAEWVFINYGEPKTVLDLFLGSGSTLIACEKTGRMCYGMELDPHYCSVILRRFAEFSGIDPVRSDGTKLSELMEADNVRASS